MYKLGSLFAGVGGIDIGFEQAGINSAWANEIDEFCEKTFLANHPNTPLLVQSIENVTA